MYLPKLSLIFFLALTLCTSAYSQGSDCPSCAVDKSVFGKTPKSSDFGLKPKSITVVQGDNVGVTLQFLLPTEVKVGGLGNVDIDLVTLKSVKLPEGLKWTADNPSNSYDPGRTRFGCIKICGQTLVKPKTYTIPVQIEGKGCAGPICRKQNKNLSMELTVLPPAGGNALFAFDPSGGCPSLDVNFEGKRTSTQPVVEPVVYEWDFGDGKKAKGKNVAHTYTKAGDFTVKHTSFLRELYVSKLVIASSGIDDGFFSGGPDLYYVFSGALNYEVKNAIDDQTTAAWTRFPQGDKLGSTRLSVQVKEDDPGVDDDLGSVPFTITGPKTYIGAVRSSEGNATVTLVVKERKKKRSDVGERAVISVNKKTRVPTITNLAGRDTFCKGSLVRLQSSPSEEYQWFKDGVAISTNRTYEVTEPGIYKVRAKDAGTYCIAFSREVEIFQQDVPRPYIAFESNVEPKNLYVLNNGENKYKIQWYASDTLIPGATENKFDNPDIVKHKYKATMSNAFGCTKTSDTYPSFTICKAGFVKALDKTSFDKNDQTTFYAKDFNASGDNIIAWGISKKSDGPIKSLSDAIKAKSNNLLFVGEGDSLNTTFDCSVFEKGDYYITPFLAKATNVSPVVHNPDSGCTAEFVIKPELTGDDWIVKPLLVILPTGDTINVIEKVTKKRTGAAIDLPLTPKLLNSFLSGSIPPIDLSDLSEGKDPNGLWKISATNRASATGSLTVTIPPFDIVVKEKNCSLIDKDQIYTFPKIEQTVAPGSTKEIRIQVPPLAKSFPELSSICKGFGTPREFKVTGCPTSIKDVDAFVASIQVYPNPTNGDFSVAFTIDGESDVRLQLLDVLGREVVNMLHTNVTGQFREQIRSNGNLSSGVYLLNVIVDGLPYSSKIIVR